MAARFHPFVQLELTAALGPPPGRYHVTPRGDVAGQDVLVISVVRAHAPPPARVLRRARAAGASTEVGDVPLQRATWIEATAGSEDRDAVLQRLAAVRSDEGLAHDLVAHTLSVINLAVRGWAVAAGDPYATEVAVPDARAVRIGYGDGDGLAKGEWIDAFVPAPPRRRRLSLGERLAPQTMLAAVLSGQVVVREGDVVLLRAALDLDQGRTAAAAAQLRAAAGLLPELHDLDVPPSITGDALVATLQDALERGERLRAGALE